MRIRDSTARRIDRPARTGRRIRKRARPAASAHELDVDRTGDQARLGRSLEERAYGLAPPGAVIDGPIIDVHADEPVGELRLEVAGIPQGVIERLLAMIQSVDDARLQEPGDLADE